MKSTLEYQVIEAYDTDGLKQAVEKAMNEDGWMLHGGVSSTYVPDYKTGEGLILMAAHWVFHQSMVRGEGGRTHAYNKRTARILEP